MPQIITFQCPLCFSCSPSLPPSLFCDRFLFFPCCNALHPLTLSSCESGCSRLCCWMAIGGGRGTESAPSSPSSSPQLCMPEELDLDNVPLDRPSLRTLCNTQKVRQRFNQNSLQSCIVYYRHIVYPPPPRSHPEAWQRCRPSLSGIPSSSPRSSSHHGSSCACEPVSSRGRLPCRC